MTAEVSNLAEALGRVRAYFEALDDFYGGEEPSDHLDYADGGDRSPELRRSDIRAIATREESRPVSAAAVPAPGTTVDTVAALLGDHDQIGYDDCDGCACGAEVYTTDAHRAHVAAVLLASGLVVPVAEVRAIADEWESATCIIDGAPCSFHRYADGYASDLRTLLARLAGRDAGGGS